MFLGQSKYVGGFVGFSFCLRLVLLSHTMDIVLLHMCIGEVV